MTYEKTEVVGRDGVSRYVLVQEGTDPEVGIPLLDLGGLDLPDEIETELRRQLWAYGIREYRDALVAGASTAIAGAIRSTFKTNVSAIIALCEREYKLVLEVGYGK